MAHKVIVKPEAQSDIESAISWYENALSGLGLDFVDALDACFNFISDNPYLFQKRYRDVMIVFIKRFPYGVHYTLEGQVVYIHAVLHTKRRPLS
jgi:plasmid stabilization system protein ParE